MARDKDLYPQWQTPTHIYVLAVADSGRGGAHRGGSARACTRYCIYIPRRQHIYVCWCLALPFPDDDIALLSVLHPTGMADTAPVLMLQPCSHTVMLLMH